MKNLLILKLSMLWCYLIIVVFVGNVYFSNNWHVICEILQIINTSAVVYLSAKICNLISDPERKIFRWFIWSNSFLFISAISYFVVNYLLHIADINNRMSLSYFITSLLWQGVALIYWGNIVKRFQFKNNWIVLLTILLVNLCLAYMLYKLPLKPTTTMSYQFLIFQIYTNIVSFAIFNFALCALICADNMGIRLLAAGFISMIGANFLTSYIAYTYNPSSMVYRNDFWLFSSCILISGLLFLKDRPNTTITLFTNERSIKNIIVGWTLSIVVLTSSLFLELASYFNVLTPQMLSILPYIMFIYIILAVFMALAISYIFEVPIREINNTIHNFIDHSIVEKSKNRINVAEFMVLNDFLLYTIGIIEERNNLQEKFRKVARQVMHDITSPITSINNIVGRLSSNVPEADRVTLRNAAERIAGISQKLLSQYDNKNLEDSKEIFLVSLALLQIINERREDYKDSGIIIEADIDELANFTCIKHNPDAVKRMISNLVNNAVEAVKNKPDGKVTVRLGIFADKAVIIVKDNGNGMPQHIQDKFKIGVEVTENKEGGHGVGLTQVRDTANVGNGTFDINADEGGTQIIIRFPEVATPHWISETIKLTKDDTVIVLDDDESIHGSWKSNFEDILEKNSTIKVRYFTRGKEVITYINRLTIEQKKDIFLLTDFELLEQGINGLEVVAQTNIRRAILVTSYSGNSDMQTKVCKAGIKMLPKELAYAAEIIVDKKIQKWSNKVDMVWVEDQKWLVDDLIQRYYNHLKVDTYYDPISFMQDVHQYPLDTRIILDTCYETLDGVPYAETGYDLAKELHAIGYTKLILYTGEDPKDKAPEYLIVIRKKDQYSTENMDKI